MQQSNQIRCTSNVNSSGTSTARYSLGNLHNYQYNQKYRMQDVQSQRRPDYIIVFYKVRRQREKHNPSKHDRGMERPYSYASSKNTENDAKKEYEDG